MSWAKLDDGLPDHPKVDALLEEDELRGLAAVGLWALSLCRCSQQLTDGAIHRRALARLAPEHGRDLAALLAARGLFDVDDSGGFAVHDFLTYNPSREEVLKRRAEDAQRKATARADARAAASSRRSAGAIRPESEELSKRTDPGSPTGRRAKSDGTAHVVQTGVRPESAAPSAAPRARGRGPGRAGDVVPSPALNNNPPSPQQAGGAVEHLDSAKERLRTTAPEIPSSGREREKAAGRERFDAFAAEHFPDGDHRVLAGLVATMRMRSLAPTVDAIRSYAATHPQHAAAVGRAQDGAA